MSKILDTYTIQFKSLTIGKHIFEFDVDDSFFEEFEGSEIFGGDLHVDIELNRHTNMLELDFFIDGDVIVQCDRCLDKLTLPIEFEGKLVVRISDSIQEDELNDEIWFLNSNEYEIALAQYLYESICLSLPIQRYHGVLGTSADECDKEMLSKLNELSVREDDKENIDSRWDRLKDIMSN